MVLATYMTGISEQTPSSREPTNNDTFELRPFARSLSKRFFPDQYGVNGLINERTNLNGEASVQANLHSTAQDLAEAKTVF